MLYKRIAAAAAALLVVGSGSLMGFRTSAPRQDAAGRAAYTAPQVNITDWQFPDGFGPQNTELSDAELSNAMSVGLVIVDNHLSPIAGMATQLPSLKNGLAKMVGGNLQVTWKLKPNQKWANGTPLTSDQAVFAVKLAQTPEGGYPTVTDLIQTLAAPDPNTLVVTYKGVYGDFVLGAPGFYNYKDEAKKYGAGDVSSFASGTYNRDTWNKFVLSNPSDESSAETSGYKASAFFKVNNAYEADTFTKPDDAFWNGPYKLGDFVSGQRVTLVPNPNFNAMPPATSGGKDLPRPSKIVFISVSQDPTAYGAALQSPNVACTGPSCIDKAEDFQVSDLPTLYSIPAYSKNVYVENALELEHLELNRSNKFLADVRVRQALELAIDKTELVRELFPQIKNPASFVANTFLPLIHPYVDKSVKAVYDVAQAKKLLAAAGYCNSSVTSGCKQIYLTFDTTSRAPRPIAAEIIKRDWAQIGVTLKIDAFKPSTGFGGLFATWDKNGILARRSFDVALFAWSISPSPDVSNFFYPQFIPTAQSHSGSQQNYAAVNDAVVTHAFQMGNGSIDFATRQKWFAVAQERVASQVYWIPLFVRQDISVTNGTIVNYKPNSSSSTNEWNAYEWSKAQ